MPVFSLFVQDGGEVAPGGCAPLCMLQHAGSARGVHACVLSFCAGWRGGGPWGCTPGAPADVAAAAVDGRAVQRRWLQRADEGMRVAASAKCCLAPHRL